MKDKTVCTQKSFSYHGLLRQNFIIYFQIKNLSPPMLRGAVLSPPGCIQVVGQDCMRVFKGLDKSLSLYLGGLIHTTHEQIRSFFTNSFENKVIQNWELWHKHLGGGVWGDGVEDGTSKVIYRVGGQPDGGAGGEWAAIDMEIQRCTLLLSLHLRPCTLHTAGAHPLKSLSQLVCPGTKKG